MMCIVRQCLPVPQAQSGLGAKTLLLHQELQKMKAKVSQLEHTLVKPRQSNLSLLDQAVCDTFPPLMNRGYPTGEKGNEEEVVAMNTSLLQGLRHIEERDNEVGVASGKVGVVSRKVGVASVEGEEEAGLPVGGDLPTELAGGAGGEEREQEKVEGKEADKRDIQTSLREETERDLNSDLTKSPPVLPTYATAVSRPFHPVLHGPGSMSSGSVPVTQQSSMSHLPQTNTVTVTNPVTTATVATENKGVDHCGNQEEVLFPGNSHSNTSSPFGFLSSTPMPNPKLLESDFTTGRQSRLSRDGELTVPSGDVLEEAVRGLPRCGSVGWSTTEWMGETGVVTPRSDSSLSLRSSSSTGM